MRENDVFEIKLEIYQQIRKVQKIIVFHMICGSLHDNNLIIYGILILKGFLTF